MGVLRGVFGYEDFRGEQRRIIDHLVGGGDALVLMPTGGGKSLPLVMLRLAEVGGERLSELVTDAWRMRAPDELHGDLNDVSEPSHGGSELIWLEGLGVPSLPRVLDDRRSRRLADVCQS